MKFQRVTIFEATNHTLKEIYVGGTEEGMHQVIARHRSCPPLQIAHWKPEHDVNYRSVEFNMAASYAKEFIAAHVRQIARPEWTIIAGTPT